MTHLTPEKAEARLSEIYARRPDVSSPDYLDWIKEVADTRAHTKEGIALRARAETAKQRSPGFRGTADFIGIMLGAKGYEDK